MKKESVKKESKTKETNKKTDETSVVEEEDFESDNVDSQSIIRYYLASFSFNCRCDDTVDKICGRRPCTESSDGYEYSLHHKGLSYLHLEWVTKDELDRINFKSTSVVTRFFKKLQTCEQDANDVISFVDEDNLKCDVILDCMDAILELNKTAYLPGWRLLGRNESIPKGIKIANLPKTWRQRLPNEAAEVKKGEHSKITHNDLAGLNPWMNFQKDISAYYETKKNPCLTNNEGSIYAYEKLYLVKWMGLSLGEATWERECDINNKNKIKEFEEYNTVPSPIKEYYDDYLPENYMSVYTKEKEINLYEQYIQVQPVQPTEEKEKKKKPRAKPRDTPSIRRNNHLRNCIDPIAPPFDKGIFSC